MGINGEKKRKMNAFRMFLYLVLIKINQELNLCSWSLTPPLVSILLSSCCREPAVLQRSTDRKSAACTGRQNSTDLHVCSGPDGGAVVRCVCVFSGQIIISVSRCCRSPAFFTCSSTDTSSSRKRKTHRTHTETHENTVPATLLNIHTGFTWNLRLKVATKLRWFNLTCNRLLKKE